MATSGNVSVAVTNWDTLKFSWWQNWQDIANNATNIGWKLELIAGSSGYISSSASKAWSVTVNGSYYSGSNTVGISNNATKTLASGTTTIYHNSDGSKTFSFSFSQQFDINFNGKIGTISGSGTGTLNSIPRQATLTAAPNFNDEGNPTISYSNPAGNAVPTLQACIASPDGQTIYVPYRDISKTGSSYTFNLTAAERNALRNATTTSNSREVAFYVTTVIGGNTYYSVIKKTLTIINATPTFTSSVKDTGGSSVPLTNNNQVMIKGFNYMNVSMVATAYKGATIKSYKITNGSNVINAASGGFSNSVNNVFTFEVWDSRGNYNSYKATVKMINYIPLTCDTEASITLQTADNTKANINYIISGNYFSGSFGAKSNSLTIRYRYKAGYGEYTEWYTVEPTISDSKYSVTVNLTDLDYREAYTLEAWAKDAISGNLYAEPKVVKATPVFDWGENDFNFNVPVTIQGNPVRAFDADGRIARAYTQEKVRYEGYTYINLYRSGSPTDLYNQKIATFNTDGTIKINKDIIALINIHIPSYNNGDDKRSWVILLNYNTKQQYTASINYGQWTTTCINIVLNLTKDTVLGIQAAEPMIINSDGPAGSYIEIIEL